MAKFNDLQNGDYVKLYLCDDWYKITGKESGYIDLVDDFGSTTDARAADVETVKLESEMDYAF